MEVFDICDEFGNPTGETIGRTEAHAKGICHRTAHIWVVRPQGEGYQVLLQKRAKDKDSFPGLFDTSSAGHIQAGDEPKESALRELSEELGIQAVAEELSFAGTFRIRYEKEFHGKLFRDHEVAFVYVYQKPIDIEELVLQEEEVECVEWFDLEEVYQACKGRREKGGGGIFCVPIEGLITLRNYLGIVSD